MAEQRAAGSTRAAGAAALREEGRRPPGRGEEARRRPGQERQPEFRVLTATDLAARRLRRQARLVAALAVTVLVGSLLAVGAAQALVASQQVRLDAEQQRVATAVSQDQQLQLVHAELASPQRVLKVAEHRLGMVVPQQVRYLSAVVPAGSPAATATGLRQPSRANAPGGGGPASGAGGSKRGGKRR